MFCSHLLAGCLRNLLPSPCKNPCNPISLQCFAPISLQSHLLAISLQQAESLQGDGSKTRQEIPQTAGWKAQGGFCCSLPPITENNCNYQKLLGNYLKLVVFLILLKTQSNVNNKRIYSRICLIRHLKGIRKKWRIRRTDELCKQVKTLSQKLVYFVIVTGIHT